jgi:hypothetical protein
VEFAEPKTGSRRENSNSEDQKSLDLCGSCSLVARVDSGYLRARYRKRP